MKEMLFRKRIDLEKRLKAFSINSKIEDEECTTHIQKSFKYVVDWSKETDPQPKPPLVFIRKSFDTKKGVEEFSFHVKGFFHNVYEGKMVKVRFNHMLDIQVRWKAKHFSPKKSVTLT